MQQSTSVGNNSSCGLINVPTALAKILGFDTVRIGFNICYGEIMRQIASGGKPAHEHNNGAKRLPGRPRSEQARQAILRSTLKLLQHTGFPDLTIEAIAADAGVGKATVYRWWPNKGALVVDAFASSTEGKLHFPDTGSVYQDVSLQMNQFLGILHTRRGRIVAALLGAGQSDPELLEAFRERFLRPRRQEAYKTLRRGIERGELPGRPGPRSCAGHPLWRNLHALSHSSRRT